MPDTCNCDLRHRQWDPNKGICLNCGSFIPMGHFGSKLTEVQTMYETPSTGERVDEIQAQILMQDRKRPVPHDKYATMLLEFDLAAGLVTRMLHERVVPTPTEYMADVLRQLLLVAAHASVPASELLKRVRERME
jgi:hypothetical protein